MALSHLGAIRGQDIIVSEDVHTVVMPVRTRDMLVGTREPLFPSLPPAASPHPQRPCPSIILENLTHDTRATPRSGAQPWA